MNRKRMDRIVIVCYLIASICYFVVSLLNFMKLAARKPARLVLPDEGGNDYLIL